MKWLYIYIYCQTYCFYEGRPVDKNELIGYISKSHNIPKTISRALVRELELNKWIKVSNRKARAKDIEFVRDADINKVSTNLIYKNLRMF